MKINVTPNNLRNAFLGLTVTRFGEIMDEVIGLVLEKNAEYGDVWQDFEILTPLLRIREKIVRMETLSDGGKALVAVGTYTEIRKELLDVLGYSALALAWLDENHIE